MQRWLRSQGFAATKTFRSGMYVQATGTAARVEHVFGTTLHEYRYRGATLRSNATPLSLPASTPAAVTGAIAGIIGIDQGSALKQPAATEPGPAPGRPLRRAACSRYYGQKIAKNKPKANGRHRPYVICGYAP